MDNWKKIEITRDYFLIVSNSLKESDKKVVSYFTKNYKAAIPFDILVPVYFDTRGKIFYHGGGFTLNECLPYPEAQDEAFINQFPQIRGVDFSPLWAFMIHKKAYQDLGPPPTLGKNIYTHADYCVRALKAGYKIKIHPQIQLTYAHAYTMFSDIKRWQGILTRSKKIFVKKHKKFLQSRYRLPVAWHSHTGYAGGYCLHSRELVKALLKQKIRLHYKFIGGTNDDEPLSEHFAVDDLRLDMGTFDLPQIVLSTGLNCFSNSGKYKIGFTTTEVDGIPKNWVKVLNQMDEVWTTSEFSKLAFLKSGVKKPVYNMREGVNPDYFHPDIKPFKNNTDKKFLFISNFAWGRRKGVDLLYEAFSKEFTYKEDVALILKVLPSYHGADIQKDIQNMYHCPTSAPIMVWDAMIPPYLLGGLYTAGNCLVFPTRGEGFGLPPLEALACGIPVICTAYSAPLEYLTKKGKPLPGVELLKYSLERFDGSDSIYYYGFNWARPSITSLRRAMRKVYNNYKKYKEGAMQTSEFIRKKWTWDVCADLVIDRLEKIYKKL